MHGIYNDAIKELKLIEKQGGLDASNLDVVLKLSKIAKNIAKINKGEEDEMMKYREGDYYDRYPDYGSRRMDIRYERDGEYGRKYMGRTRYGHFDEHLARLSDCVEDYELGRSHYRSHGNDERMIDGLERTMMALVEFAESAAQFAETPEEKEIIRKHLQRLKNI
jgi:hypothetical protein